MGTVIENSDKKRDKPVIIQVDQWADASILAKLCNFKPVNQERMFQSPRENQANEKKITSPTRTDGD